MVETTEKYNRPVDNLRPFKLIRYFVIIGLAAIILAAGLITTLDNYWLTGMQRRQNANYAKVLLENLNHQVVTQFVLPIGITYGRISLRERNQFELLDRVVRNTVHSFNVANVNVYDMEGTVTYSWDTDLIGRQSMISEGYLAALDGQTHNQTTTRGFSLGFMIGKPRIVQQTTFAPLFWEEPLGKTTDNILGVLEVTVDMTGEYREVTNIEILVSVTSVALMLLFFGILIYVVHRGEVILNHRAREQMRLRERLSRAEKFSALGELTGSISHEIRNPLGIIRSSAELLKKRVEKTDPDNNIPDIIVEESTRLNLILTDFINFARPQQPNMHLVNVNEVINKNVNFLEPKLMELQGKINVTYADNLPAVMADESMLYQVFLNLIMNSMQAVSEGSEVTINVTHDDAYVYIKIDDNGGGVPEDVLAKIWDPFFTTKEKGTGLGLGIVRNIIELHDGEISIANLPDGAGARVEIKLPVSKEPIMVEVK